MKLMYAAAPLTPLNPRVSLSLFLQLKGSKIHAQLDRWSAQAPASSATSGLPGGGSGCQGTRSGMLIACEDVRFHMSHGATSSSAAGGKDRPICL